MEKLLSSDKLKVVEALFDNEIQISSFILDQISVSRISNSDSGIKIEEENILSILTRDLESLSKVLEFLNALGWVEHTSDWDPWLMINFVDEQEQFESPSGYFLFDVDKIINTIVIEAPDEENLEEDDERRFYKDGKYVIPINLIKSIDIMR
jgi:hypothetical protein